MTPFPGPFTLYRPKKRKKKPSRIKKAMKKQKAAQKRKLAEKIHKKSVV